MTRLTEKDINFFIKRARKNPDLTDWEDNFIDSIVDWIGDGKALTEKQEAQLQRIGMKP